MDDDKRWRLEIGDFLRGEELEWKRYRQWSDEWDHDHCAFCFAKFIDPAHSTVNRKYVEEHPEILTEGYATTDQHEHGAEYHWVCKRCFDDFADELGMTEVPPNAQPERRADSE